MPVQPRIHVLQGASLVTCGSQQVVADYGSADKEYEAAVRQAVLHDRSYRGLIEIRGADRTAWLHNLLTNEVNKLAGGEGNYAFALTVKGRILFDCNCLVADDAILLDVQGEWVPSAVEHLGKYVIMEDVTITDVSASRARLALIGPEALTVEKAWAQLQHANSQKAQIPVRIFRNDFCGLPAAEYIVDAAAVGALWTALSVAADGQEVPPAGLTALQNLRIEAGIPWSCQDIDDSVLPAETGQLARAVSFQKGCYLGQEVVERMRARGAIAKVLVGLAFDSRGARAGMTLQRNGDAVGRVTSVADSARLDRQVGLGYVKTQLATPATELQAVGEGLQRTCRTCPLPFGS